LLSNVWVIFEKLNWVSFSIVISILNISTITTTVVFGIAIDELRLSKVDKLLGGSPVGTLHGGGGGKGPA
jgi:hypothetical protein